MLRTWILSVACSVSLLGGCVSVTHVQAGRHDQFRNALVDSCRSIQASDFHAARDHLDDAQSLARGPEQAAKVVDLGLMLDGAESLHEGRPQEAANSWLSIRDRSLKGQVIALADAQGIDIYAISQAQNNRQETSQ
ncbi:MAG: hypothetical protein VX527_08585 [Planctomycetota bacterium]|nr:hypothetical protein [Planctomycetota bacterium]